MKRLAAALLAACSLLASAQAALRSFELAIDSDRRIRPAQVMRVLQGEEVRIHVRAAAGTELHVHGYDKLLSVGGDAQGIIQLHAHVTGRFPVEVHGTAAHRAHRTAAYLEVMPR